MPMYDRARASSRFRRFVNQSTHKNQKHPHPKQVLNKLVHEVSHRPPYCSVRLHKISDPSDFGIRLSLEGGGGGMCVSLSLSAAVRCLLRTCPNSLFSRRRPFFFGLISTTHERGHARPTRPRLDCLLIYIYFGVFPEALACDWPLDNLRACQWREACRLPCGLCPKRTNKPSSWNASSVGPNLPSAVFLSRAFPAEGARSRGSHLTLQ